MFSILIDDSISAVLTQLSTNADNLENQLEKAAGDSYLQDVLGWIDSGEAFTSRTGQLRGSIVLRQLAGDQVVSAGNNKTLEKPRRARFDANAISDDRHLVNYAPMIEFGNHKAFGKGRGAAAYPYFYTDLVNRQKHIDERLSQVVRQLLNEE